MEVVLLQRTQWFHNCCHAQDINEFISNFKTNQIKKKIPDFSLKTSSLTPSLKPLLVILFVSEFNQENRIITSNLGIIVTWEVQPKGNMEWAREMSGKFSHIFGENLLRTSYVNPGMMNPDIMKQSENPP